VDAGNGITVVVPPGALTQEIRITAAVSSKAPPVGALSPLYEFGPDGTTFLLPVTVTVPVPAGAPSELTVVWSALGIPDSWENVGGTVSGATISAQVTHFSGGWLTNPCGRDGGLSKVLPPPFSPVVVPGPASNLVSWDDQAVDSYLVYFEVDSELAGVCWQDPVGTMKCKGNVIPVAHTAGNSTQQIGLKPFKSYRYRVASVRRNEMGGLDISKCGPMASGTPYLEAPNGLTAEGGPRSVTGTFYPAVGAKFYWVEWDTATFDPNEAGHVAAHRVKVTAGPVSLGYAIPNLTPGLRHYLAVRGATDDGEGPASAVVSALVLGGVAPTVEALFARAGTAWNTYVKNDAAKRTDVTQTPCEKATWVGGASFGYTGDSGGYGSCIHAGEMRLLTVPDLGNCTGVTAEDDQQALRWICDDSAGTGIARIVSVGLNEGKGLRDLLDLPALAWKRMTLTVRRQDGTVIVQSTPAAWWTNVVARTTGQMDGAGTVYVLDTPASGEIISADGVAVVTNLSDAQRDAGQGYFDLSGTGNAFAWVEGHFVAISLTDLSHSVLRGISIGGATAQVLRIGGHSAANLITEVTVQGVQGVQGRYGFEWVSLATEASVISRIDVASTGVNSFAGGVQIMGNNNVVSEVVACCGTTIFIGGDGLPDGGRPGGHVLLGATLANRALLGVRGPNVTLVRVATAAGSAVSPGYTPGLQNLQEVDLVDWTPTFLGPMPSADPANLTRGNPKATPLSGFLPTDWVRFATLQRGWGFDPASGVTGTAASAQACIANQPAAAAPYCQIWDFGLKTTDTALRVAAQDTIAAHVWNYVKSVPSDPFPASQLDCNRLAFGSTFVIDHCESTFLADAVEIGSPGRGNGNGLCDSGEDCLAAPNVGGYQGHGPIVRKGLYVDPKSTPPFQAVLWGRGSNGYDVGHPP
jgi:hypothetical protein